MTNKATESAFKIIMESSIWRINGPEIDLCEALIKLCEAINDEPEDSFWYDLGEGLECTCSNLIIGAYWALTEWHGGQNSDEYRAMSAIGEIYKPGMMNGPEEDSSEADAYQQVCKYFEEKQSK